MGVLLANALHDVRQVRLPVLRLARHLLHGQGGPALALVGLAQHVFLNLGVVGRSRPGVVACCPVVPLRLQEVAQRESSVVPKLVVGRLLGGSSLLLVLVVLLLLLLVQVFAQFNRLIFALVLHDLRRGGRVARAVCVLAELDDLSRLGGEGGHVVARAVVGA